MEEVDELQHAQQAVRELEGPSHLQHTQAHALRAPRLSPAPSPPPPVFFLTAEVASTLERYSDVCVSILSTLRPRLLSSLRISVPPTVPDSALLALLDEPSLTADTPHPLLGGHDLPGPAWLRLQRRWVEVRGLEEMIHKMREGQEVGDLRGLEEVEERMRRMGLQQQQPQPSERREGGTTSNGHGSSGG